MRRNIDKPSDAEIAAVLEEAEGDRDRARRRLAARYPAWIHTEDARRRFNPVDDAALLRRLLR